MKDQQQDLFNSIFDPTVDAICITTNGQYTEDGVAAMFGGCAGVCARKWPATAKRLGKLLRTVHQNIPFIIGALNKEGEYITPTNYSLHNKAFKCLIISFPTLNFLGELADLELIQTSAAQLKEIADRWQLKNILIPRPGCGIGGLDYYQQVQPVLSQYLDDRFTIVCQPNDQLL
jgi:hypothetical protein